MITEEEKRLSRIMARACTSVFNAIELCPTCKGNKTIDELKGEKLARPFPCPSCAGKGIRQIMKPHDEIKGGYVVDENHPLIGLTIMDAMTKAMSGHDGH